MKSNQDCFTKTNTPHLCRMISWHEKIYMAAAVWQSSDPQKFPIFRGVRVECTITSACNPNKELSMLLFIASTEI